MLLLAYSVIGAIMALLGAAVWRFKLTDRFAKNNQLTDNESNRMARNASLLLIGLGLYAVLCGYFAQQTSTTNGQIMVMILFVVGAQVALAGYMYWQRQ
ncbi:MAG: hypothetical protein LH609_07490 [Rudanella sp.]|nr:hypothetical protein [Rudanella sp.]